MYWELIEIEIPTLDKAFGEGTNDIEELFQYKKVVKCNY